MGLMDENDDDNNDDDDDTDNAGFALCLIKLIMTLFSFDQVLR